MNLEMKESLGCPAGINPRYWLFAIERQPEAWSNNVDFILWIGRKLREFRVQHPEAFVNSNLLDQEAFDVWLATQTAVDRKRLAKAERYFASMMKTYVLERRSS